MKKQNLILGLVISLGITLIAALPKAIRMEKFDAASVLISMVYNFCFCMAIWVSHQFILHQKRKSNINSGLVAITAIVLASTYTFIIDYFFSYFTKPPLLTEFTADKRIYLLLLRGLIISSLMYFIAFYLYMIDDRQKATLEIAQLKQVQLAANLSSLKEQLSPHFLFNTLNTLSSLTQEKNVKDYVSELANVYRYVLQYKEMDTATLQQELAFIRSYLYIIKTRLENAIDVNIDVGKAVMQSKIPPLTLQLLIENAIKHNIASTSKPLHITIKDTVAGFLVVSNNLQLKSSVQTNNTGIGLDNVMQRYQLLFNKEITIDKSDVSFTIKLPVV